MAWQTNMLSLSDLDFTDHIFFGYRWREWIGYA